MRNELIGHLFSSCIMDERVYIHTSVLCWFWLRCVPRRPRSHLMHVSDYAPTLLHVLAGVDMGAGTKPGMALDGHNMWACLSTAAGPAKEAACAAAGREDILYSE